MWVGGIAAHLLLATCGGSHPPAAVSDCTRCAEHSRNIVYIDWFSKSCTIPLRHYRSASVGGERFVSTARPMPGRESGTGGDTKLQKGAVSADVHVEQRGAPVSLTRELGSPSCPRGDRVAIGQGSLRVQTAPRDARERTVCVDRMPQAYPMAAETHRAPVTSGALVTRGGARRSLCDCRP
jgi:hypothetical protein